MTDSPRAFSNFFCGRPTILMAKWSIKLEHFRGESEACLRGRMEATSFSQLQELFVDFHSKAT